MILGPDKKRLSKRHGAAGIQEFRNAGFRRCTIELSGDVGLESRNKQELFPLKKWLTSLTFVKCRKKGCL
ncbi:MAG: hypothetical protein CM1200mP10_20130 [Candidatus Neomarinimicrobiota bacterium]|nr:MAG: hypothetical protein CM1200mP10_20130 [Candidatus Neomarinimicrobiota bacterium]